MRRKQLYYLAVAYFIFTVLNAAVLIFQLSEQNSSFEECFEDCIVPADNESAVYLFARTIVYLYPTVYTWIIFYVVPNKFLPKVRKGFKDI